MHLVKLLIETTHLVKLLKKVENILLVQVIIDAEIKKEETSFDHF